MAHTASKQTFSYKRKKKDAKATKGTSTTTNPNDDPNEICNTHFLEEPTSWMEQIEGKVFCPKCKTRIGALSWRGSQCSCGSWVAPSISFPKSKVDKKTRTANGVEILQAQLKKLTMVDEEEEEVVMEKEDSTESVDEKILSVQEDAVVIEKEDQNDNKVKEATTTTPTTTTTTTPATATKVTYDKSKIKELKEMGFEVPLIKVALRKTDHVVQDAMMWLFSPEAMDYVDEM